MAKRLARGQTLRGGAIVSDDAECVAEIAAAVAKSLACTDYGAVLSARGHTLVALNDVGEIVEYRADRGTSP